MKYHNKSDADHSRNPQPVSKPSLGNSPILSSKGGNNFKEYICIPVGKLITIGTSSGTAFSLDHAYH